MVIHGIATQGAWNDLGNPSIYYDQRVTNYEIRYSLDCVNWTTITDTSGQNKVCKRKFFRVSYKIQLFFFVRSNNYLQSQSNTGPYVNKTWILLIVSFQYDNAVLVGLFIVCRCFIRMNNLPLSFIRTLTWQHTAIMI